MAEDDSADDTPRRGLIVVSGASTGIGEATARRLAAEGFDVIAGVRTPEDAQRLGADPSGRIATAQLDVTVAADITSLAELVSDRADAGLQGLVNNAGVAVVGPIEVLGLDDWRRQIDVNLIGQVAVTRALLPALFRARGRVVNVSSISGLVAGPLTGPYSASKFALEAFTDVLRREVGAFGIRVVAVEPGVVATPIWAKGQAEAERRIDTCDRQIQRRYARMVDAARAIGDAAAHNGLAPGVVADTILTALTTRRPRTRYLVGRDAHLQARLNRLLPDQVMDALVRRVMRGAG
jgi:NAD(P)-dependent dehydrogenase (short-subunit alcohol dehydrogenase family)